MRRKIGDFKRRKAQVECNWIEAAAIAKAANIETWVVNGLNDNFILNALKRNLY
jgi:glutamate 5-kinase